MMWVQRICYWLNYQSHDWCSSPFSSPACLILYSYCREKFCLGHWVLTCGLYFISPIWQARFLWFEFPLGVFHFPKHFDFRTNNFLHFGARAQLSAHTPVPPRCPNGNKQNRWRRKWVDVKDFQFKTRRTNLLRLILLVKRRVFSRRSVHFLKEGRKCLSNIPGIFASFCVFW